MDEIIDSIYNGQRKQALEQLINSQYLLEDLFERLLEEGMYKDIVSIYKIAVRMGYITFKE